MSKTEIPGAAKFNKRAAQVGTRAAKLERQSKTGAWDESKHPRHAAGSPEGGEFAPLGESPGSTIGQNGARLTRLVGGGVRVTSGGTRIKAGTFNTEQEARAHITNAHNRVAALANSLRGPIFATGVFAPLNAGMAARAAKLAAPRGRK